MDVPTALVSPTPANDRIVTSRVACVDSPRESSPVPREASFHAEATTIIDRTRAFDFYRGYDGENLLPRPFEDFSLRSAD